jgi:Rrf2 family protein
MVRLTRKADYGLRLMLEAGASGDACITTRAASRRQKIPYQFLRQVATVLAAEGLLATSRGTRGGVRLARPPGDISLLDIVNAFGGVSLNDCTAVPARCTRTKTCPAFPAWLEVQAAVERALAGTNLETLLHAQLPRRRAHFKPIERGRTSLREHVRK